LAKLALRSEFKDAENWPFRGLKDFVDEGFRDVMEPDAQALYEMRNHLEHSYLKVHDPIAGDSIDSMGDRWKDRLAYSVKRGDFEARTLCLMKLARAAVIYLVLGMHREEGFRAKRRGPGPLGSMPLDTWRDDWKR
jgi:LA2681-like HEPN